MAPAAWSQDFPDASDFFDSLFASNQINDEDSNNGSFYSNPHLDDLLVQGRRELDPAARKRIYDEADHIICSEAPWAVEYQYRFYGVHQPYVKQLRWNKVWSNYVRDVWLDKPRAHAARRSAIGQNALASIAEMFR
jgi:ABC-type oligopeptide transport system substrate-binding subunit